MTFEIFPTKFQAAINTFADCGWDKYKSKAKIVDELWPQIQCTGLVSYNNATKKPQSRTPVKYKYSFRIFPHSFHPSVVRQIFQGMTQSWCRRPMYDTQRRGRIRRQESLSRMGKYSLADILGHEGANQSLHTTKKFTRPGGTIIIRTLTDVLIVVSGGGAVAVVEGTAEGSIHVADTEAEAVNAEIIMTRQTS